MNFGAQQFLRACRPSSIRSLASSAIGVPAPLVYSAAAAGRHARSLTTTTTTATSTPPPPPPPPTSTSTSQSSSSPPSSEAHTESPIPNQPTPIKSTPLPPHTSRKYGTVISCGKMDKVVRVQFISLQYHKHLNKDFPNREVILVSDPNNSLRQGDVIEFWSGWRSSRNVRHVVERIMTPFGTPVSERPHVMNYEERMAFRMQKRVEKRARKDKAAEAKGKVIDRSDEMVDENGLRVGKLRRKIMDRMERERQRVEALKAQHAQEKAEGKGEGEAEVVDKAT